MPDNHKVDIGSAEATFHDITLPMGLRVDTADLTFQSLHIDSKPFSASLPRPGGMKVFVSTGSLTDFLNAKQPGGLKKFALETRDGKLIVQASVVMLIEMRATAVCALRVVNGTQLYVDLENVSIMGAGATQLVQNQLEKMNPVLDLSEFPIPATIEQVEIDAEGIRLTGSVSVPAKI